MPKKKKINILFIILAAYLLGCLIWFFTSDQAAFKQVNTWQQMTSPGPLSTAHASLQNDCAACHTPGAGATPTKCILCHANNTDLLKRQPTAFHANVTSCNECHSEHTGGAAPSTLMDHAALAKIGLRDLAKNPDPNSSDRIAHDSLKHWMTLNPHTTPGHTLKPSEALLNCATCHQNDDQHFGLFGTSCIDCHTTKQWNIPKFRHPSASSTSCAQCHQAPPSHYMMHFKMISQKVAGKPKAKVSACYTCHQTTSWPDIKGTGWYKHH